MRHGCDAGFLLDRHDREAGLAVLRPPAEVVAEEEPDGAGERTPDQQDEDEEHWRLVCHVVPLDLGSSGIILPGRRNGN